jgi:hypothetical protein
MTNEKIIQNIMNTKLRSGILLYLIGVMFFGFQFIIRMSVGILRDDIMSKYSIGVVEFGSLAGIYYLGYSICPVRVLSL